MKQIIHTTAKLFGKTAAMEDYIFKHGNGKTVYFVSHDEVRVMKDITPEVLQIEGEGL